VVPNPHQHLYNSPLRLLCHHRPWLRPRTHTLLPPRKRNHQSLRRHLYSSSQRTIKSEIEVGEMVRLIRPLCWRLGILLGRCMMGARIVIGKLLGKVSLIPHPPPSLYTLLTLIKNRNNTHDSPLIGRSLRLCNARRVARHRCLGFQDCVPQVCWKCNRSSRYSTKS